jgi:predicted O-methyltransferase YrrM
VNQAEVTHEELTEEQVRRQFANPRIRQFFEQEFTKTHAILSNPQIRFAPPGHFYSPLPDPSIVDRERDRLYALPPVSDGVALNAEGQRHLLEELIPLAAAFDWPEEQTPGRRFFMKNDFYAYGDALLLFAMIRRFNPRHIIEVGSGFSSALMLDTNDLYCHSQIQLTFIEPYPDRLKCLLRPQDQKTTRLIAAPVQSVSVDLFDQLDANDFLFIDSSHVSKLGSDVNHMLFSVLPRLRPGVIVHVHDIFYPFEYPPAWVREGRAWNEVYLLRAFLQYNSVFEVLLFNAYLAYHYTDLIKRRLRLMSVNPGCALWLRRCAPSRF